MPGGVTAQGAFDVALNLAQEKRLSAAVLEAARKALRGGSLARTAFDTALAIGQGKRLQDIGLAAVRSALSGGLAAQQGFDVAVNVARGKSRTGAVLAAARARLPDQATRTAFDATVSARALKTLPYAADALSFARIAGRGRKCRLLRCLVQAGRFSQNSSAN